MINYITVDKATYYIIFDKHDGSLSGDTSIKIFKDTPDSYTFFPDFLDITIGTIEQNTLKQTVQIFFDGSLIADGLYNTNNVYIQSDYNPDDRANFKIDVKVYDSGGIQPNPEPIVVAPKYTIENTNIEGDVYRTEIWETGFEGEDTTYIRGSVVHKYVERKDITDSVLSSSLSINLEANENLTLQDLYTEDEGKYIVKQYRNDSIIFHGLLKPDGLLEDFVSSEWEISLDAMDGLNILTDLSFVKDSGGFYEGKISQFEAVKQCLHRIGYDLPINISIDLRYNGYDSVTGSILNHTYFNADRFYQDKETNQIMSCEEVLKSVLEPYNATIIQMNGEWWIYRTIDLKENTLFFRCEGEICTDGNDLNTLVSIGSHIDNYPIHHINANQRRSINASAQTFRANYKYGTVKAISRNPNLELGLGLDADGWTINISNSSAIKRRNEGVGFYVDQQVLADLELIRTNQTISVTANDQIDVIFNFNHLDLDLNFPYSRWELRMKFKFQTANYILSDSGWIARAGNPNSTVLRIYPQDITSITETIGLPPMPESGALEIVMYVNTLKNYSPTALPPPNPRLDVYSIEIVPNRTDNYAGEYHNAQRLTRISSTTKTDKTVNNGDSISDIYLGTLYDKDLVPTTGWHHLDDTVINSTDLLRIMVVDTLRLAPRPMYEFEGDVYGYIPYLSLITINNSSGKYQFGRYSFDTNSNINKSTFLEFDNVNLIQNVDYTYEKSIDYGKEIKVLINP